MKQTFQADLDQRSHYLLWVICKYISISQSILDISELIQISIGELTLDVGKMTSYVGELVVGVN